MDITTINNLPEWALSIISELATGGIHWWLFLGIGIGTLGALLVGIWRSR